MYVQICFDPRAPQSTRCAQMWAVLLFLLEITAPSGLGFCKWVLSLFPHRSANRSNNTKCFWNSSASRAVQPQRCAVCSAVLRSVRPHIGAEQWGLMGVGPPRPSAP